MQRKYKVWKAWEFPSKDSSFTPSTILKESVFLPFAALEHGRSCCFDNDPYDDTEPVKSSFFDITENDEKAKEGEEGH